MNAAPQNLFFIRAQAAKIRCCLWLGLFLAILAGHPRLTCAQSRSVQPTTARSAVDKAAADTADTADTQNAGGDQADADQADADQAAVEPADAKAANDRAAEFRAACARTAASGTTLAVPGTEGWLFLRSELRHIGVGPFWGAAAAKVSRATTPDKADPLPAIVDFHKQLAARDIELLVLPVPCKAVLHADRLGTPRDDERLDVVHQEFYRQLAAAGVSVLDLTQPFADELAAGRAPFCQTDSHWSPSACELAARLIRERIGMPGWLPARRTDLRIATEQRTIVGDLTDRMGSEQLPVQVVSGPTPGLLEDKASPLLLLGDSHTLVFHAGQELHGSGAGLADQLAHELGVLVDVIGVRGSGATAARVNLLRRAKADPKFLAGKRLVVWCFAAREFTEATGWSLVPLGAPPARNGQPR